MTLAWTRFFGGAPPCDMKIDGHRQPAVERQPRALLRRQSESSYQAAQTIGVDDKRYQATPSIGCASFIAESDSLALPRLLVPLA